eukprot:TRINITY_DN6686_c0_g2_i1.p1 TRINITY_DN6686_c0_g2~~TRINITY_DN6686_c0_g2_i1.p1  ORF type:complete len:146 (+),score=47.18 TRINITY_DN6686_c0_g2_i1:946-1383(+)
MNFATFVAIALFVGTASAISTISIYEKTSPGDSCQYTTFTFGLIETQVNSTGQYDGSSFYGYIYGTPGSFTLFPLVAGQGNYDTISFSANYYSNNYDLSISAVDSGGGTITCSNLNNYGFCSMNTFTCSWSSGQCDDITLGIEVC